MSLGEQSILNVISKKKIALLLARISVAQENKILGGAVCEMLQPKPALFWCG